MNLKEEKNKKVLLIIIILGLIVLICYKLFFGKKIETEKIDTKTISLVENPSDFYTVSSCVSKVLGYISADDGEKLYSLLTDDYKDNHTLSSDNVFDVIGIDRTSYYNFNARKIYVQRLSESLYKFYIYGLLEKNLMDSIPDRTDYYIIIILDRKNMTFAFEPYAGEIFK